MSAFCCHTIHAAPLTGRCRTATQRWSDVNHGRSRHKGRTQRVAATCGCKAENALSRRALQAELLAAFLLTAPLQGQCSEDSSASVADAADEHLDLTITDKVFFDIGLCPQMIRTDTTLGDSSALCTDAAPLGRITLGLYGKLVPQTVANFCSAINAGIYTNTIWSKVLPGQYVQAGQQGSRRTGAVDMRLPESVLTRNPEVLSSKSFRMSSSKPGTVSLSLGTNDDDSEIRQRPGYHNTEFVIAIGPGPASNLDGENIAFGKVLQGYDTIRAMTTVPTFKSSVPDLYQKVAVLLRDERAAKVRAKWGKPLKAIVITGAGMA